MDPSNNLTSTCPESKTQPQGGGHLSPCQTTVWRDPHRSALKSSLCLRAISGLLYGKHGSQKTGMETRQVHSAEKITGPIMASLPRNLRTGHPDYSRRFRWPVARKKLQALILVPRRPKEDQGRNRAHRQPASSYAVAGSSGLRSDRRMASGRQARCHPSHVHQGALAAVMPANPTVPNSGLSSFLHLGGLV